MGNPFCPKCKKLMYITKSGYYKCPQCKEKYKRGQDVIIQRGITKPTEQVKELKSTTFEKAKGGRPRPIQQRLMGQEQKPLSRKVRRRIMKMVRKTKNAKKKETVKIKT